MWKRIWKRLLDLLFVLVHPGCWLSNYDADSHWDAKLNEMLDNPKFEALRVGGRFSVKLNGHEVWISNFPYAYGSLYFKDVKVDVLPYRRTRYRLRRLHNQWRYSTAMEKVND